MLNVPTQSFPAASSQQRVATSGQSARNKVVLKPGHSLMDWIRFSKSSKDLTGLRGRLLDVTPEELEKHNTPTDCWTCIRGLVYNVTPYLDYHPGGEAELMRAAGIDGTELFDQVHRWVNYESMLKECLVGRMTSKPLPPSKGTKAIIPSPPASLAPPTSVAPPPDKDTRPRYDWFQTDSSVHLVVYTKKKIPSSGCSSVDLGQSGTLRFEALLGKMSYIIHLRLSGETEGNVSVHCSHTVGKIQVSLRKQTKGEWSSLGQPLESHNTFLRKKDRAVFYRDCVLVSKTAVNYNTHIFRFRFPRGTVVHVPVGHHVYLKASIHDTEVVRAYTPVDQQLLSGSGKSSQEVDLYLMIKVYPDGVLTPHLHGLTPGSCVSVGGPDGSFSLRLLRDVTSLYLLAAGTGFTPMARLIRLVLEDTNTAREAKLLFFNRREEDILLRDELQELTANNHRFQVEHVLSEPPDSWCGLRGRVDQDLIKGFLSHGEAKRLVCVCGPTAFTELAIGLLQQLGCSEETLHVFQG